jgi:hypothetical protein
MKSFIRRSLRKSKFIPIWLFVGVLSMLSTLVCHRYRWLTAINLNKSPHRHKMSTQQWPNSENLPLTVSVFILRRQAIAARILRQLGFPHREE